MTRGTLASCPPTARVHAPSRGRVWVVMVLLVALSAYGLSGTLLDLLGLNHRHERVDRVAALMDGWHDSRRSETVHVEPQPHSHALWQRHHHDRADASVIYLDASTHDASTEDSTTAAVVAPMWTTVWSPIEIHAPLGVQVRWPGDPSARMASQSVEPLDRPPNP